MYVYYIAHKKNENTTFYNWVILVVFDLMPIVLYATSFGECASNWPFNPLKKKFYLVSSASIRAEFRRYMWNGVYDFKAIDADYPDGQIISIYVPCTYVDGAMPRYFVEPSPFVFTLSKGKDKHDVMVGPDVFTIREFLESPYANKSPLTVDADCLTMPQLCEHMIKFGHGLEPLTNLTPEFALLGAQTNPTWINDIPDSLINHEIRKIYYGLSSHARSKILCRKALMYSIVEPTPETIDTAKQIVNEFLHGDRVSVTKEEKAVFSFLGRLRKPFLDWMIDFKTLPPATYSLDSIGDSSHRVRHKKYASHLRERSTRRVNVTPYVGYFIEATQIWECYKIMICALDQLGFTFTLYYGTHKTSTGYIEVFDMCPVAKDGTITYSMLSEYSRYKGYDAVKPITVFISAKHVPEPERFESGGSSPETTDDEIFSCEYDSD